MNRGKFMKEWHQTNKDTEKYKKRNENISKSKIGKKRPDMIGNKFSEGKTPWNKDLTAENDERVRKNTEKANKTKRKLFKEGKLKVWNDGLTKEEFPQLSNSGVKKGNIPWNDGLTQEDDERIRLNSKRRDKTMKEKGLYGRMKGKKNPKGALAKLGEKNPMYGKKQSKKYYQVHSLMVREKSPNWQGGKSFEPYTPEFNKMFKLAIKQRDGFMCVKCGMREEDHIKLFGIKEHIHHIDYIKENTLPQNCCVLCRRCNLEVNSNRKSWTKFFQSLLAERYGYQYSENGEIIINLNKQNETKNETPHL